MKPFMCEKRSARILHIAQFYDFCLKSNSVKITWLKFVCYICALQIQKPKNFTLL